MQNAYKTIRNGRELLEWLQSLSPEELELTIARTDNSHALGPFYDEIDGVSIQPVCVTGGGIHCKYHIVF